MAEQYNGWSNYQTWAVALWLDNTESTYQLMQEAAQSAADYDVPVDHLAAYIEEFVEDGNPLANQASMYSDLLVNIIARVDWREIAQHLLEQ